MHVTIRKSTVEGVVRSPSSKSYTHRALVCATLAHGKSRIHNPLICDDTLTTMNACKMMGANIRGKDLLTVDGPEFLHLLGGILDCKGSGTTLRFFTALSALIPGISVLTGDPSLRRRPVRTLLEALHVLGVKTIAGKERFPPFIVFGGKIAGGNVILRGDISSQFLSALLLTCPKAVTETTITTLNLQSSSYVDITINILEKFDIEVFHESDRFFVVPQQDFKPKKLTIEGDFSSASFLLAAGVLCGKITISGLNVSSLQGDKKIIKILERMGANVEKRQNEISIEKTKLNSTFVDISDTPDLGPVCAVLGTQASGTTTLANAERLTFKESNRVVSIVQELRKMGACIKKKNNGLVIKGPTPLKGSIITPHNDHRIAMMCAIGGLVAHGETVIKNVECIRKSYPRFVEDLAMVGADVS